MSGATFEMEKKPVTNSRYNHLIRSWVIWLYLTIVLLSFGILVAFWFTNFYQDSIESELKLKNGTPSFDWWLRPPVRTIHKVYIFNYTNVEAFQSGEDTKLKLQQVGPYTYRETLRRVNVQSHANGTVTFQEKRSYQWESGSLESEKIIVPNIPLLGAIAFSRNMNFVARVGLTALFSSLRVKTFVELEAGEFMWGYDDKIFNMGKPFLPAQNSMDKFGMLVFKRGVSSEKVTMYTGEDDINHLGVIEKLNGRAQRDVWDDEECDKIAGTDGSMFPPALMRDRNKDLLVYARDLCRSLRFKYAGPSVTHGIPTYRYKLPLDALTCTPEKNSCYCSKPSEYSSDESRVCPPRGIFNVSACKFGTPFLTSFPHFYAADETLFDRIDGLKPEQSEHETYLDMHQRLGFPIGGRSRFQVNVEVRKAGGLPFVGNLKDGDILPLLWMDIGIDKLPEALHEMLMLAHFTANTVEDAFKWGSAVVFLVSSAALYFALKKKTDESVPTKGANDC